ncbi:hypothetical protein M885DRAFT_536339 [Pelagophyceae sp. CCMP2097]|nr:hypothetical protein M885DRAFT_536339 [Pelagophyceae sp. CCMP2097]
MKAFNIGCKFFSPFSLRKALYLATMPSKVTRCAAFDVRALSDFFVITKSSLLCRSDCKQSNFSATLRNFSSNDSFNSSNRATNMVSSSSQRKSRTPLAPCACWISPPSESCTRRILRSVNFFWAAGTSDKPVSVAAVKSSSRASLDAWA